MAKVWFGNINQASYVEAPEAGMDADFVGVEDKLQFLSGGAHVTLSESTHREFNMSWATKPKASLNFLTQYRNGVYGTGLLYWVDVFASNHFPPHVARPELSVQGWPSLVSQANRGTRVAVTSATGMPKFGAQYTLNPNIPVTREHVLLIPSDKELAFGISATVTGSAVVRMQRVKLDGTLETLTSVTLLSPTGTTRINTVVSGATYKAVRLYITNTGATPATITLVSAVAMYKPITTAITYPTVHTEGEGHSGLRFEGAPTMQYIQSAPGRSFVSAAAKFTEVGAWL